MSTNGIKTPNEAKPEEPNAGTDGMAREKVCPPLLQISSSQPTSLETLLGVSRIRPERG
jgi:hypothetical protein